MKGLAATVYYHRPLQLLFLLPATLIVVSAKPEDDRATALPIGVHLASSSPTHNVNSSPSRSRSSSTRPPTTILPGDVSSPPLPEADRGSSAPSQTESRRSRSTTTASIVPGAISGLPATLQSSSAASVTAIASTDLRRAALSSSTTRTPPKQSKRGRKPSVKCAAQCEEDYKLCLLSGRPKRSLDALPGSGDRTNREATIVRRQSAAPKTCRHKYSACMNSCSNRSRKTSQRAGG